MTWTDAHVRALQAIVVSHKSGTSKAGCDYCPVRVSCEEQVFVEEGPALCELSDAALPGGPYLPTHKVQYYPTVCPNCGRSYETRRQPRKTRRSCYECAWMLKREQTALAGGRQQEWHRGPDLRLPGSRSTD